MVPPALLSWHSACTHIHPSQRLAPSLLALFATLGALAFWYVPQGWLEGVFLGCWISVIATATTVHLVRGLSARLAFALSVNVGVWRVPYLCVWIATRPAESAAVLC